MTDPHPPPFWLSMKSTTWNFPLYELRGWWDGQLFLLLGFQDQITLRLEKIISEYFTGILDGARYCSVHRWKGKVRMGFQVVFCLFFQKILKVTPVVYPRLISNYDCIIARGNPWKKRNFYIFCQDRPPGYPWVLFFKCQPIWFGCLASTRT